MTYTITDTPTITPTAAVPVVLSVNVVKPEQGGKVDISFKAPEAGRVTVKVFNLAAELVRPVFEADVQAGIWYLATWDGKNEGGSVVGSGVYFISVKGAGVKMIRKVVILR